MVKIPNFTLCLLTIKDFYYDIKYKKYKILSKWTHGLRKI